MTDMFRHSRIAGFASHLPENVVSNEDLERIFPDFKSAKIEKKLGIQRRHIAAEGETALDLAEQACRKLFLKYPGCSDKVDYILLCTQSPDYFLPTGACLLQDRLGLKREIGALDFNLGCSGFVYGLSLAKGLIAGGIAENVLLVTAETYSKYLRQDDKGNRSIFGDAAAACWVTSATTPGIMNFSLGTDGRGAENLIVKNGCARYPDAASHELFMNGPEIFNFTIDAIPPMIADTLKRNQLELGDVKHFVFHQANQYMLSYLRDKMQLPEEKFHIDMRETGNVVSASIPVLLEKLIDSQTIRPGEIVLLAGFGVGYSWGAVTVVF